MHRKKRGRKTRESSGLSFFPVNTMTVRYALMIEIQNLNKTYDAASGPITALRDINLTIEDGEIFGIIGLSGAGKSTLVRCINLLERPTSGKVVLAGQALTALPRKALLHTRQSIGMIFQGFNLLEQRTVLKNVCFPLEIAGVKKNDARKRAAELLELVGLSDRANAYPSQLSGGQKQRVAIARALATKPKYLLCDEATSALDPTTTQSILALLKQINQTLGVTIVVITHEMRVIEQICDRVAVIDQSRIAEIGKVSEVFVNPQSDIAKALIIPNNPVTSLPPCEGRRLRLVFDNRVSGEPIISRIAMECHVPVNIVFADTRFVEGNAYGHMILELPNDENQIQAVLRFLDANHINYEED